MNVNRKKEKDLLKSFSARNCLQKYSRNSESYAKKNKVECSDHNDEDSLTVAWNVSIVVYIFYERLDLCPKREFVNGIQ